ncbi:ABC transporter substrate-binding protein [Burkholderia sp. PAMC 28687]|jgi:ribose transport system substrate-binding protein|uniref:ABC transporter, substrate binding protein n=1 Tax=Caballeronia sordidicola TaxID=196367 RepID=A0A242N9I3_CABSO|nr:MULTISPECIES: ABC transporter substrate-binding protein [Burkholderiaceae]AMH43927.1 ABC transporter substrate-binding protein [Burkholderia sp. PAMC 26561]AMM16305.1 ABC transporter substrate-binding protein [Burkholderia sp. PAMC 28687]OTP78337.1 ABC transporter, substrate binding protein [Caballeronia sordidicola]OTP80359.1 ABC transporter, substrate binding protein [Caballeronia sordidicola]
MIGSGKQRFGAVALAVASVATCMSSAAHAQVATGDTSQKKIALSNSFAGNAWRQSMLKSWGAVSTAAVQDKKVAAAPAFTTAENQVTEQAQQVQNLILQGYNAIVIDAVSPTALNGTIKKACAAGVVVVSFDGIVDEPCAYRVNFDFKGWGEAGVDYLAKRLNGKGNILEVRGVAGISVDNLMHEGVLAGLKKYPGLKLVGSVNGDWTQSVAQKAVAGILPTLPQVDGVATEGEMSFGIAQAFKAANRPVPAMIIGSTYAELNWWNEQSKNGYQSRSLSNPPGAVSFAFWVAQQVLAGKKIPKDVTINVPLLEISQEQLQAKLQATPQGGISDVTYTLPQTVALLDKK